MSVNRIWIQFYKDVHLCGEPIQGSINVACYQPVANAQLKFKLKAYEEAKWVDLSQIHVTPQQPLTIPENQIHKVNDVDVSDESSDSDEESAPDRFQPEYIRKGGNPTVFRVTRGEGKHRILGQTHELGPLTVGHHSFPFQFNSLAEWPGTFHQEENKAKGKIKYNLIAWYGNFRTKQEIFLQEYKRSESDKLVSNASITSCCCLSKGNVKLEVSFSKDALYIGEECEVNIDLDCTQLSCNVSNVTVSLVNNVTFTSDQGQNRGFSNSVFTKQTEGCQAGQMKKTNQRFSVNFQQAKHNNRPTTSGRIVRSKYNMNVFSGNDASCTCCSSDAAVGNETHIFSRPTNVTPIYQEQNWNPSIHQIFNIPLMPPVVKAKKYKVVQQPVTQQPPNNGFGQPGMFNPQVQNNNGVGGSGPTATNPNQPKQGNQGYNPVPGVGGTGPTATNPNQPIQGHQGYNPVPGVGGTGPTATNPNQPIQGHQGYNPVPGVGGSGPTATNPHQPIQGHQGYNPVPGVGGFGPTATNPNQPIQGHQGYNPVPGVGGGAPTATNPNQPIQGHQGYNPVPGVGGAPPTATNPHQPIQGNQGYNPVPGVGGLPPQQQTLAGGIQFNVNVQHQ